MGRLNEHSEWFCRGSQKECRRMEKGRRSRMKLEVRSELRMEHWKRRFISVRTM